MPYSTYGEYEKSASLVRILLHGRWLHGNTGPRVSDVVDCLVYWLRFVGDALQPETRDLPTKTAGNNTGAQLRFLENRYFINYRLNGVKTNEQTVGEHIPSPHIRYRLNEIERNSREFTDV